MSKIINVDADRLYVVRDEKNIIYYNKSGMGVYLEDGVLILTKDVLVVERLVGLTLPAGDLQTQVTTVQGYIDQYVAPTPDPTILIRANTVGEPDTLVELSLGTNLSVTGTTLNAASGGAGEQNYRDVFLLMGA
jgi:hypothetical protein